MPKMEDGWRGERGIYGVRPLQAYRFRTLMERLRVEFADRALTADLQALSAGFATSRP